MGIVTTIAPIALALLMLGLGASLTFRDFLNVFNNLIENAIEKRIRKGCDWILLNDVSLGSDIMGGNENHITLISADETQEWPRMSKTAVAKRLAQKIVDYSK